MHRCASTVATARETVICGCKGFNPTMVNKITAYVKVAATCSPEDGMAPMTIASIW